VTKRLGHTLTKGHARTDWTRRPLSAEQLSYAADDVRYLAPLYLDLREACNGAGRLTWLEEEMQLLRKRIALPHRSCAGLAAAARSRAAAP